MAKRSNTRGAQGDGTIRKRKDGRWEARYTLGVDPGSGKQVQKSVYGKSQDEVRKKLKGITTEVDQGIYTEPTKMTVGQWLDIWIAEYNSDVKDTTVQQYKYQINTHLKPGIGSVKLSELTAVMLQQFVNSRSKPYVITQLSKSGKPVKVKKKCLSAKSIHNMHSVLHEALVKAMKLGYIRTNVCDAVTLPRAQKVDMHPITGPNVKKFLEAIKGDPYEDLYYVTMFTGLREGEVLGLTWDCIDFAKSTMKVYRQLQRDRHRGGPYQFVPVKNSKTRIFMIPDNVKAVLLKVKREQAEKRLQYGSRWENEESFVFTNESGHFLMYSTVYAHFKRCVKRIGIPETRFHDLRHTYATLALQQGVDVKTVSENLGHATVAFTLDVYGHVTEEMQKRSADLMQAYLEAL